MVKKIFKNTLLETCNTLVSLGSESKIINAINIRQVGSTTGTTGEVQTSAGTRKSGYVLGSGIYAVFFHDTIKAHDGITGTCIIGFKSDTVDIFRRSR